MRRATLRTWGWTGALAVVCGAWVPAAAAQAPERPSDRPADERQAQLARWKQLTPEQRQQLLQRYERFKALPAAEQATLQQRLQELRAMEPRQLDRLRKAQERWRRLAPEARAELETRVARFRELPPERQLDFMEKAEAVMALPAAERERLRALPPAEQRDALKQVVWRHRLEKVMRKLTPEERAAIAAVPEAEQRAALHQLMAQRRAAQMARLPAPARERLASLPPGREREQAFKQALDAVNRFEREAGGLLTADERTQWAALAPEERSARFRALAPELVQRAIARLPEPERARIAALEGDAQIAALRELRQRRLVERGRALLRPPQWRLLQQLPPESRAEWFRELVEANRDAYLATLSPADREAFAALRPGQRDARLREWLRRERD